MERSFQVPPLGPVRTPPLPAFYVGVSCIVSGIADLVGGRDVLPDAMFGIAEITFGVLALPWPDATLIVIAVLFGVRTVLFGLTLVDPGRAAEPRRSQAARMCR